LKHVDGFHIILAYTLHSEIASRIHKQIFTLAITYLVEFGQHFIHELCSVRFGVWYPAIFGLLPRTCVFMTWRLKFNTPKTQFLMTCRGTVDALDFSILASHSCAFLLNIPFFFLKKTFHLNLGHT